MNWVFDNGVSEFELFFGYNELGLIFRLDSMNLSSLCYGGLYPGCGYFNFIVCVICCVMGYIVH